MRVEVKHNNPPKTNTSPRVELPINLPTPAPTPIVAYENDKYAPPRVESEPTYRGTPYYNTQHQKWFHNVHNQVKDITHLISNCIQEKLTRKYQPVKQHYYLTKMTNEIIDEDTGVAMEYIHIIKTQNTNQFVSNTSPIR